MLYFKDFKETKLKNEKGLGGSLVLLTSRSDESVSYVVKGDEREQSINEFVAAASFGRSRVLFDSGRADLQQLYILWGCPFC